MSSAVEEHPAASAADVSASATTISTILARRSVLIAVAVGGVLVAIGAGLLVATSDHLVQQIEWGLIMAVRVLGWFSAALYWLVRRPGNRLGPSLLALAVAMAAMSLQGATQPLLRSTSMLAVSFVFLLVFYVLFAFPEGRIASRLAWALLGAMVLSILEYDVPGLLFSPVVYGPIPLADCDPACPANGFMIADRPTLADGFVSEDFMGYYLLAAFSAFFVYLGYRLATATRPRRRALLPVYLPALLSVVPVVVYYAAFVGLVHVDARTLSEWGWLTNIGYAVLPYGFLLSIVVSTFFAATALKKIVSRLVESPSAAELRTTLADALDDPSLELGFRLEQADGFVDSSGKPLPSTPPAGQSSTPVTRNGETVAVIMHDAALETDPELVAAAGQALLLAIENGRLTAELQSTNTELRATRARIVATGDAQRRRIERDLHDGAQQHLAALSIRVGLARELADPEAAQRLDDVGKELDEILEELRDLAHGLYPPLLREFGLREALTSAVRRSASPAKLEAAAIGRYPEDVEAAVYFCCVESLQNVDKHAGVGATAVIRLWERDSRLYFEIVDDGLGYDARSARGAGQGLANMSDRIGALGGTLVVESAAGRGTTVRASIPVDVATRRVGFLGLTPRVARRLTSSRSHQGRAYGGRGRPTTVGAGRARSSPCGRTPPRRGNSFSDRSSMHSVEISTTVEAGCAALRRRAVSNPSIPGMRTSTSTRSGSSSRASTSASSPEPASPKCSKPSVASITSRAA